MGLLSQKISAYVLTNLLGSSLWKGYANVHFHQQCMRMPIPIVLQQTVLSFFLIFSNLVDEEWYLSAVLIGIPLNELKIFSCLRSIIYIV